MPAITSVSPTNSGNSRRNWYAIVLSSGWPWTTGGSLPFFHSGSLVHLDRLRGQGPHAGFARVRLIDRKLLDGPVRARASPAHSKGGGSEGGREPPSEFNPASPRP